MPDRQDPFSQAAAIVNSFLTAVVIFYLIDHGLVAAISGWFPVDARALVLIHIVLLALRVYVFSGLLGCLVQMASGEIVLFDHSCFKDNARRLWKPYLAVILLPVAYHFVLFVISAQTSPSINDIFNIFSVPLYCLMAALFIARMYSKRVRLSLKEIRIDPPDACALLGLFALAIGLSAASRYFSFDHFLFGQIALLSLEYLDLLVFVYLALLIMKARPVISATSQGQKELWLINPPSGGTLASLAGMASRMYQPIFVILKSLTPKDYTVRVFNNVFWRDRYYQSGKLVGITCLSSNSAEAYHIAKGFREKGSKVIMGGPHVSVLPDEALSFCDSVVIGEVENLWPDIVRDYENNALRPRYFGEIAPAWPPEILEELLRSPAAVVRDCLETGRGCLHHCSFCVAPYLTEHQVRKRNIDNITALIRKVKDKYSMVDFFDDNIYSDPLYARELFRALKPLNIRWSGKSSIDIAKNDEVSRLARESGCQGLLIGYEISGGSPEKKQGGKMSLADQYLTLSRKLTALGIGIKAHFILGFDSDDIRSIFRLWAFCFRLRPKALAVTLLTPLPGSQLFDQMLKADRFTTLNWRNFTTIRLVIRPQNLPYAPLARLYPLIVLVFYLTASQLGNIFLVAMALSGFVFYLRAF